MNLNMDIIRRYEDLLAAERALARSTRTINDLIGMGRRVPPALTARQRNEQRLVTQLDDARPTFAAAFAAFDSSEIDARLTADIAALEAEALGLYNRFHPAQMRVDKALELEAAIPLDAQENVDKVGPQLAEVLRQLEQLYPLRDDHYARVKSYMVLDALKERGKEQVAGIPKTAIVGVERHSRRRRSCTGKKYRVANPKPVKSQAQPKKGKKPANAQPKKGGKKHQKAA